MRLRHARAGWWYSESGQGLVEFVLVIPLVLLLFFGIFQFAHYYSTRLSLRHTVREAARFAVTGNVLQDSTGQNLTRERSIQQIILSASPHLPHRPGAHHAESAGRRRSG